MEIPVIIGVTGHRGLREQDLPRLRELVSEELKKIKSQCPNSECILLDSIASGADTFCAQEALALGMKLVCPLPFPVEEYRRDFSGEDEELFEQLLEEAEEVFVVPDIEPRPQGDTRDYHYRQAGIYVEAHSHVLLALWDGQPGTPGGCGTAEIVECMLLGNAKDGQGCFKAANDGAVLHVLAPRAGVQEELELSVRLLENQPGSLEETLRRTDAFNREARLRDSDDGGAKGLLPAKDVENLDGSLAKIHGLYRTANRLSLEFQEKYLGTLRWFSVFGVALVLLFLFYDEFECDLFLLFYGGLLLAYGLAFIFRRRGGHHEKYLQYRMLAETLRMQFYLKAAGMEDNIGTAFTWTQKQESTWIKETVSALLIGGRTREVPHEVIREAWIDGQLRYHEKTYKRDYGRHCINERITKWMLALSVLLFVAVFLLEFFLRPVMTATLVGEGIPGFLLHHAGQAFTVRSLMKILLGGISAITVFLANYYGKLSFERKSIDHRKMIGLFQTAKVQFESGQVDKKQVFRELAREEIIENGNWFSYCKENPPSFNL